MSKGTSPLISFKMINEMRKLKLSKIMKLSSYVWNAVKVIDTYFKVNTSLEQLVLRELVLGVLTALEKETREIEKDFHTSSLPWAWSGVVGENVGGDIPQNGTRCTTP